MRKYRPVVSGDLGDSDVYGDQQHAVAGPRAVSAIAKLLDRRDRLRRGLKALAASRQLGYAIPEKSLAEGLERAPDYIGADMGPIARICAAVFRGELPLLNR